jgi:Flp pilus assembly protein TadG
MITQRQQTISRTLHRLRGFLGDCSGSVASEFALILPVTALMLTGLIEFGMAVNDGTSLENGARAGAQFALNQGLDSPGILAVVANASNLDPETLTVTSREFWECSGSWGVEVSSSTNCGTNVPLAKFIEVRVVHQYAAIFPYLDAMAPDQMESTATLRVP